MLDFGSLIYVEVFHKVQENPKSIVTRMSWNFEIISMKMLENMRTHIFETLDFGF